MVEGLKLQKKGLVKKLIGGAIVLGIGAGVGVYTMPKQMEPSELVSGKIDAMKLYILDEKKAPELINEIELKKDKMMQYERDYF